MKYKYHYVVFNYYDSGFLGTNKNGFYSICLEDLSFHDNITVVNYPLDHCNFLLRFLYWGLIQIQRRFHVKYIGSMRSLFYPYFFKKKGGDSLEYCFVFMSYEQDRQYLNYLKKKYPHSPHVKVLRDLASLKKNFIEQREEQLFDYWMSYDQGDCERYNMIHFNQFESKVDLSKLKDIVPTSDIFFIGRAKNRLGKIYKAYNHLTALGYNCLFLLLGVEPQDKIIKPGIKYINRAISYRDVLSYIINTKCILDINQENAQGVTARYVESILYNKFLLSDNPHIAKEPLFNKDYMQVFSSIETITLESLSRMQEVTYDYRGEFSPLQFIKTLNDNIQ